MAKYKWWQHKKKISDSFYDEAEITVNGRLIARGMSDRRGDSIRMRVLQHLNAHDHVRLSSGGFRIEGHTVYVSGIYDIMGEVRDLRGRLFIRGGEAYEPRITR